MREPKRLVVKEKKERVAKQEETGCRLKMSKQDAESDSNRNKRQKDERFRYVG